MRYIICKYFIQSMVIILFLMVSFKEQEIFIFIKSNLSFFCCCMECVLCVVCKKSFINPRSQKFFSYVFLQKFHNFSSFI